MGEIGHALYETEGESTCIKALQHERHMPDGH